jgi:hypothetical protein
LDALRDPKLNVLAAPSLAPRFPNGVLIRSGYALIRN